MASQLTNPPNTAIGVPLQQAISNLQMGMGGLGGSAAGGSLLPGPAQAGLQSRSQLGLPDRSSYFAPFLPSPQQAAAAGAIPGISPVAGTTAAQKNLSAAEKAGNKKKVAKIEQRHPELG